MVITVHVNDGHQYDHVTEPFITFSTCGTLSLCHICIKSGQQATLTATLFSFPDCSGCIAGDEVRLDCIPAIRRRRHVVPACFSDLHRLVLSQMVDLVLSQMAVRIVPRKQASRHLVSSPAILVVH